MTQIRLLALDLDGTVLDSAWKLSKANHDALLHTYERGVQIVFVTGRRYQSARSITSAFDFPHFIITTAGAMTRHSAGNPLFTHTIQPELLADLLQHIAAYRPWTFLLTDENQREDLWCEGPCMTNPHVARYLQHNTASLHQVPDLETADAVRAMSVIEVILLGHIHEMRAACALLDSFPERHRLKVLRTEYIERDLCLLDIVDGATDKGQAVRQLADSLGIPRDATMAIGDNHSDLDMLAYAGFPVVMGNAPQELKSAGWPITATNDEDGVAQAIEQFILANPSQTRGR